MEAHTSEPPTHLVTRLLDAVGRGESGAGDKLWSLVYDELHRMARCQMAQEHGPRTLQTTALVNEAYLRLVGGGDVPWASKGHFFAAAAKAMREIRVDDARRRGRLKRGGRGVAPIGVDDPHPDPLPGRERGDARREAVAIEEIAAFDQDPLEVLAIDEALTKLGQFDPRKAEVVMLRYFAGLTVEECAQAMGLSPRTVNDEWRMARTWLYRELNGE